MKKKVIVSSILVIALCLSLIAGSTFALFTSETGVNVAVTSAKVNVVATVGTLTLTSRDVPSVDGVTFANGGTATYDAEKGEITLTNITPGDKVAFDITVTNNSNVTIQYRITWVVAGELYTALVATADGEALVNNATGWAEWKTTDANTKVIPVTMELPIEAGNEYQEKTASVVFKVEAVQGNGTDLYETPVTSAADLQAAFLNGGEVVLADNITLADGETIEVPAGKDVVLNLNGKTISSATTDDASALIVNNGNLVIVGGNSSTYSLRSGNVIENTAVNGGAVIDNAGSLVLDGVTVKGAPIGTTGYPEYAVMSTGKLVIEEGTTITSDRGALRISGEGEAVINGGSFAVTSAASDLGITLTCHTVMVHGDSNITIFGGLFENNYAGVSGASVLCPYGGDITVYDGTFRDATDDSSNFNYTANIQNYMGANSVVTVYGGSFDDASINGSYYQAVNTPDCSVAVTDGIYTVVPNTGLVNDGANFYVYNADGFEALNAKMADKSAGRNAFVTLMADIDFTGKTWTPVDSHADTAFTFAGLNGNGHTIYNLTVNGQAMFTRFAGTGDVVVKDVTFDGATVTSSSINTSILTGHSYQNVLLDNVDVKNSSITGGYKVAPLIATVYNESPASTVTATLKNCDVADTTVTATSYDFCTAGMVAFVYADDNDMIEFENCTVTNVKLYAPDDSYKAHAFVYATGSSTLFNEVEGVTVTNCTFEAK